MEEAYKKGDKSGRHPWGGKKKSFFQVKLVKAMTELVAVIPAMLSANDELAGIINV